MFMSYDHVMMLCEGCHRTSAWWISGAEAFELRLVECRQRWPAYEDPEIRRRGRPFGRPHEAP